MTKNFQFKKIFFLLNKNLFLFSEKFLFFNFLKKGHTDFFHFTYSGNLRPSIFIFHWNFEWSSKIWNVFSFDQCEYALN